MVTGGVVLPPAQAQPRTAEELQALRQIVMNALGLKLAPGQTADSLVSLQELPFQAEPVEAQIQQIQSETRVQGWLDTASKYIAVLVAAVVLFIFWRMLGRQRPEPVPMELLSTTSMEGARTFQGKNTLTADALNELIQRKPANVGGALRDWMAVKKN